MELKQTYTHNFSFLRNNLLENQRQWPVLVRDNKLTVDPMLFSSTFGKDSPSADSVEETVANTPGIRMEYMRTPSTKNSDLGTEGFCTVTISGSGTYGAKARITWPDSTTTDVNFVTPSGETKHSDWKLTGAHGNILPAANCGPFPVFMTLQELCDTLDTFVKEGTTGDGTRTIIQPSGFQWEADSDPTVSSNFNTLLSNWGGGTPESGWNIAATLFMPLLKNMNQASSAYSSYAGGTINESWSDWTTAEHIVTPFGRFDHNPSHLDAVKYGVRGMTADMKSAVRAFGIASYRDSHGGGTNNVFSNAYPGIHTTQWANHGTAPNPKWRMRTALAIFLKDGTYTISAGGAIIPYTYDPDRSDIGGWCFGGKGADKYYYGTWNGSNAAGTTHGAQIYGGFVQGPFCPSPQAANIGSWGAYHREWQATSVTGAWWPGFGVPPGPTRDTDGDWPKGPGYAQPFVNPLPFQPIANDTLELDGADPMYFKFDFTGSDGQTTRATWSSGNYGQGLKNLQVVTIDDVTDPASPITATQSPFWANDAKAPFWIGDCHEHWHNNDVMTVYVPTTATGKNTDSLQYTWHTSDDGVANLKVNCITDPYWIVNLRVAAAVDIDSANYWMVIKQGVLSWYGGLQPGDNPDGTAYESYYGGHWPDRYLASEKGTFQGLTPPANYGNTIGRMLTNRTFGLGPDDGRVGDYWFEPDGNQNAKFTKGGGCLRISPGRFLYGVSRDVVSEGATSNYYPQSIAHQGIQFEMWLHSDYESTTGKNAFDHVKPTLPTTTTVSGSRTGHQWPMGRNRNWPGHTRAWGTKLGHQPCLMPNATDYGVAGYGVPTTKYSLTESGCSPMFIDLEILAYIPSHEGNMTRLVFEPGTFDAGRGVPGLHLNHMSLTNATMWAGGNNPLAANKMGFHGHYLRGGATFGQQTTLAAGDIVSMGTATVQQQNPCTSVADNPVVWYMESCRLLGNTNWVQPTSGMATKYTNPPTSGGAFGGIESDTIGTPFEMNGGHNKWRCAFDNGGMSFFLNDQLKGTYVGGGVPVYSFSLEQSALNYDGVDPSGHNDALEKESPDQLYLDEMNLRQVPSLIMLPFTIETTTITTDAAIYNSIEVEGSASPNTDYDIKLSVCAPGTTAGDWDGYGQAPGTPLTGFENIDLQFSGGYGSTSLKSLPASVFTDGFTLRFEFYIPHSGSENAPINWKTMPEILNWKIKYDRKPTASASAIGNTFNNDISSPITTEVGHIITFSSTGTTTDPDRLIKHVQYTFGDGTVTDWIELENPAMSVTHTITHSYAAQASSLNMTVQYKDDNGNLTDATTAIVINVNASNPVATLRASPITVRAGQTIRLDASKSYDVDSDTLTNFTFTPGDGSTAIGPQAQNYTDHTYSVAGEYRATLTCEDGAGNSSNTASCIIKVLPATLVVPLSLNTQPSSFTRSRSAKFSSTPVLDAAFPEMRDTGFREDKFTLNGMFLEATADIDIAFMEELMMSGALVEFEYQAVNYTGTPDSKTFVGRMVDFQYEREGGQHGQTPYSATFIREASLGV